MSLSLSELIERYERMTAPDVYDILDQMGYPNQALSTDIRALDPAMKIAGPAYTVLGRSCRADAPPPVSSFQMFRELTPQCVMVMSMGGHRVSGPWGENSSISAKMRGARGAVLDGATRDANATVALGFPTFVRTVTPVFSQGRFEMVSFGQPIQMPGQVESTVNVRPGDFVVADRDGVVIVPQEILEAVLLDTERLEAIERHIKSALLTGEDREAVYKRYPKFDHVQKRFQQRDQIDHLVE